jgi:hypothetical protein
MPPVSMALLSTSPGKHRLHGKLPSAGTTSTQSGGFPKFGLFEQRLEMSRLILLVDRSTDMLAKEKQAKQLSVSSAEHLSF